MSDNEPGKYPGDQDPVKSDLGGVSTDSTREWTGSFFWPTYRDLEAAKKHTRRAALIVFLFTLTMTYISLLSSRGEWTSFGLSLTAIYLMSAVAIYFFYLPGAYFGAAIFIITNLLGLVYRLATVGLTQISWLVILNTIVFVIFYARSIEGVRQYKAFFSERSDQIPSE